MEPAVSAAISAGPPPTTPGPAAASHSNRVMLLLGERGPMKVPATAGSAIAGDLDNGGVASNQFNGVIDTGRISSVARSGEEICAAAGISPDQCQNQM